MAWNIWCFILFLSMFNGISGTEFKQEKAKVQYANEKYVGHIYMFTFRENRRSPYLTNFNITTLVPFGENVTIHLEFINVKLQAFPFKFKLKVCDALKTKWIKDWLKEFSNIPTACLVPPAIYQINRFEWPPKNFPFKFNDVDYAGKLALAHTTTNEKIIEVTLYLKSRGNNN